jgi:restriction system protein
MLALAVWIGINRLGPNRPTFRGRPRNLRAHNLREEQKIEAYLREKERAAAEKSHRVIESLLHRDADADAIDRMSGEEFEEFMAEFFRRQGYSVRRTGASGDQGIDLLLDANGRTVAVQLKRWARPVGNREITHTLGGMVYYGADEAWLITTSSFTPKAREMAERTRVRLIDGKELTDWIGSLGEEA